MAGTHTQSQRDGSPSAVACVPVTGLGDGVPEAESGRMVRSAALRLGRRLLLGGLLVIGWVLGGFLLGWAGAAPAAADTLVPTLHRVTTLGAAEPEHLRRQPAADSVTGGVPHTVTHTATGTAKSTGTDAGRRSLVGEVGGAVRGTAAGSVVHAVSNASTTAAAMAGRRVNGLTSQYTPGSTAPSAEHTIVAHFVASNSGGGGSGPFGPGVGDVARSIEDPRLMVLPVPLAGILPPVVRTAADDPSFSPD